MVLPVWNGEPFLSQAIRSVLAQTLDALELIVVDDGSTDRSAAIAQQFADRDARVRVLRLEHCGFSGALNAGIAAASAPYVARMDCDDAALPTRLEKQARYLDAHPECVAVGSAVEIIDQGGRHVGWRTFAESHAGITAALMIGASPFSHPTVVARRDALLAAGCYDGALYPSEDLDLWIKLGHIGRLANLGEVLLQYRRHENAVSVRHREEQFAMTSAIVNDARERRGLQPLRARIFSSGKNAAARYHFDCARVALIAGTRWTAIRHVCAAIAADPRWPSLYVNLLACAVPKRLLRFAAGVRGRIRLMAAHRRRPHPDIDESVIFTDE